MHAMLNTDFGGPEVLQPGEVVKPTPTDHHVLVRVIAASLNPLDVHRFKGNPALSRLMEGWPRYPKYPVLGADIAGIVEAVGAQVTHYQPGDEVFGIAAGSVGGFAEYALAAANGLAHKPANLSFEQAAAAPVAAITALQAVRDHGQVRAGQEVLINGASGGVGTFAVQLARHYGAEVTAVCGTDKVDMLRSLGAHHIVDYSQHDITRSGRRYDLIFGVNGYHSLGAYRRILKPGGQYIGVGGEMKQILEGWLIGPLASRLTGSRLGFMGISNANAADMSALADLLASGSIRPVIDRCYPLDDLAEAVRYLIIGHAAGKIVLTIAQ